MYYTIYKITNLIDGKIYIGCHKTGDLDDGYMGSGKYLKRAINKHGIDNFIKDILQVFDNPEDMFEMEAKLVNEGFVKERSNYNLKVGGEGGFDYINENGLNLYGNNGENGKKNLLSRSDIIKLLKERGTYEAYCKLISLNKKKYYADGGINGFKNKRHTEESKKKIGKANSILQKGKRNSQYGTMWICNHDLKENIKILKTDPIPDGWVKGRKIKW